MATPVEDHSGAQEEDGELVTEFPPPPYYYTLASSKSKSNSSFAAGGGTGDDGGGDGDGDDDCNDPAANQLMPPPIPYKSLERASMKAVEEMNKKKEEAEKNRLAAANAGGDGTTTGGTIGGDAPNFEKSDNGGDGEEDDVAVFGEYVEDPLLSPVDDCADPRIVKEEIFRLNKAIVHGFVKLVRDLVQRPVDNKKSRDELSHNIFLMLQECNKFREHQAREIFIETLETQLTDRQNALTVLKEEIEKTDTALAQFERIKGSISDES